MKKRGTINLIIDLLLLLLMAAMTGIGFLMAYVLLPGRDRIIQYGSNRDLTLWGLDRHQWGDIHLILGFVLLVLLVLHIVFHWECVLSMVRQRLLSARWRQAAWLGTALVSLFLMLFPFLFSPLEAESGAFLHRNQRVSEDAEKKSIGEDASIPHVQEEHDHSGELNGRMTLGEAAACLGLTLEEVRKRLDLQDDVDEFVSLGRIRRKLGLSMEDLRKRLQSAVPAAGRGVT